MTAVVPTRVQYFNFPTTVGYGSTNKRMVRVIVEVTSTAVSDTINLATYVPNIAGILSLNTILSDKMCSTATTWSTVTLTTASGVGDIVYDILGYYT